MRNYQRSRSLVFLVHAAIGIAVFFSLSGCHGGEDHYTINLDSVKPHVIPIREAMRLTANFRAGIDTFNRKCPGFKDSMNFGKAEAFNKDALYLLLKQKDSSGERAAGIRIYYGRDEKGVIKFVLVPYDKNGNDIINKLITENEKQVPGVSPAQTRALAVPDGDAIEQGQLCPPVCAPASPLN